MVHRVDIIPKKESRHTGLINQIKDSGIGKIFEASCRTVYFIESNLPENKIEEIVIRLLIDPVTENYILARGFFAAPPQINEILVTHNPGVCDPVALSLEKAIKDLNVPVATARTARWYKFDGLSVRDIEKLAPRVLYNPLIEHVLDYNKVKNLSTLSEFAGKDYCFELRSVDILSADDNRLMEISKQGCLSLSLEEMRIIKVILPPGKITLRIAN